MSAPIILFTPPAEQAREIAELRNQLREERLLTARLTRLLDDEEAALEAQEQAEALRARAAVQLGRALGLKRRAWRVVAVNGAITVRLVGYAAFLFLKGLIG